MKYFNVPWSLSNNRSFTYNGIPVVIGKLKYSAKTDRHYLSITVAGRVFDGIALISGVDLLERFSTGLPPLYAFNTIVPIADPNPDNLILVFEESE